MLHVKSFLSFVNYDTIQLGMNINSVLASQNEQLSGFRRILQKQLLYALPEMVLCWWNWSFYLPFQKHGGVF